jgi:hypothetical protein
MLDQRLWDGVIALLPDLSREDTRDPLLERGSRRGALNRQLVV